MGVLHTFFDRLVSIDSDREHLRLATPSSTADIGLSVTDIHMLAHQRAGVGSQIDDMMERVASPVSFPDFERWRQLEVCQTCNACQKAWDCRVMLDDPDHAVPKGFCPNEAHFGKA